ncbi:hypothetical protein FQZ97_901670 [compost metagenome]
MMAPGIEVSPPRITTGRALSATSESENCTPSLEPQMIPATSAEKPATDHTITQMRDSGMPMDCAAWWSSATARSARPVAVFWKKMASTTTSAADTAAATRSSWLSSRPPSKVPCSTISGSLGMPTSIL